LTTCVSTRTTRGVVLAALVLGGIVAAVLITPTLAGGLWQSGALLATALLSAGVAIAIV
jgi:hypothetical protein